MKSKVITRIQYPVLAMVLIVVFQNCGQFRGADSDSTTTAGSQVATDPGALQPTAPPLAPSQLIGLSVSSRQINLHWQDNSSTESGFKLERATSASGPFKLIRLSPINISSFSDTGLAAATTYYYRVSSTNSVGDSAPTSAIAITTLSAPTSPPSPPSNLTATATSPTSVTLTWSDNSSDESGFSIERSLPATSPSFAPVATTAANVGSYTDSGLTGNINYIYRVSAVNDAGSSNFTAAVAVTTPAAGSGGPNSFGSISANIFAVNCTGCHDFTYTNTIALVVKGNSASSTLYKKVSTGAMPPRPSSPLTAAQVLAIKNWIDGGALNN